MKFAKSLLLISLFSLTLFFNGSNTTTAAVNKTGWDITFQIVSFRAVDDYDLLASGEWHIFLQTASNGGVLDYSGERSASDNQLVTINLSGDVHLNYAQTSYLFYIRGAENDGLTSTLEANPDYDRTMSYNLNLGIRNSWVYLNNLYDGVNVYYNCRYFITDNAPILNSTLQSKIITHGQSLSFSELQVTDEVQIVSCYYDFNYLSNIFTQDYSAGSNCAGFTLNSIHTLYPDPGSYTYAVRLIDSGSQIYIATANIIINNYAPSISLSSLSPRYLPNSPIQMNWGVTDYNPNTWQILANGSVIGSGTYSPSPGVSSYTTSTQISIPNDGQYNITLVVIDDFGLVGKQTRFIEILTRDVTDFSLISPLGGEQFVNQVQIEWNEAVDSWGATFDYTVYYSSNNGTLYNELATVTGNSYLWDTTAMARGDYYKIKVTTNSILGLLSYESALPFRIMPVHGLSSPILLGPNLGNTQNGVIKVSWSVSVDTWDHLVSYNLQYAPMGTENWVNLTQNQSDVQFNWDTTTIEDGWYKLKVIAYESLGLISELMSTDFQISNTSPPATTTPPPATTTPPPSTTSTISETSLSTQLPSESTKNNDPTIESPLPGLTVGKILVSLFGLFIVHRKRREKSKII